MKTVSEGFFEFFCQQKGIRWKRVAEEDTPTADYDIYVPRRKVVVEVKEITPNKEERQAEKELAEKSFVIGSLTPGQRVRKKISEADRQIKYRTRRRYPGLVVLFDRGFVAGHLDSYQIRVAMYGFETLQIAVPRDQQVRPYTVGAKYGKKRKMTPNHNTSISAIGALHSLGPRSIELTVYHNAYASVPLDPALLKQYGIQQFGLQRSQPGAIAGWEDIGDLIKPDAYNALNPNG